MRLVDMPAGKLNSRQRHQLDRVLKEYRDSQANHAERASSHLNLGNLDRQLSNHKAAEASFRNAIRLEPYLTGPRSELASLLESQDMNPEEAQALRRDELELLERDAKLLPDSAATFYRLGLTYFLLGDLDQAQGAFQTACELAPQSYDFLMALALLQERRQQWEEAVESLNKMRQLNPGDPRTRQIYERLLQTRQQQGQTRQQQGP
jgi:tetratricopeptide (TPR) repeat protein